MDQINNGTDYVKLSLKLYHMFKLQLRHQQLMAEATGGSFLPKLKLAGLAWVNFQVMRRTHSSLLKELDVDPQIRAEQMGHTVDVNENVYTITSINRRKETVNALERALEA